MNAYESRTRRSQLAILSCALWVGACDRQKAVEPVVSKAVPSDIDIDPAATGRVIPASAPASRPSGSVVFLDGTPVVFPACKLVLPDKPGSPVLVMSDDPPEAINENFAGNSFYFELPLDVKSVGELADMVYPYRAASAERFETLSGIFLDGNRRQLQPYDYSIAFGKDEEGDVVTLRGVFLQFDSPDDQAGKQITVAARFRPKVIDSK